MKLQSNKILESLTTKEIRILAAGVKETLATNIRNKKRRIFSAAQLWDINRRKKNFSIQRNYF